jgi:hypothetical protein
MSEDEACPRVAAARIVGRFPTALPIIERGEIHLTGLLMLREHLTAEGGEEHPSASSVDPYATWVHRYAWFGPDASPVGPGPSPFGLGVRRFVIATRPFVPSGRPAR